MAIAVDEYTLEDVAHDHPIPAEMFVPFTIVRLRGTEATVQEAALSVRLQDIGTTRETLRTLRLRWTAESVPVEPLPVQEHVITEWAALGVACALVTVYLRLRVLRVASGGERFDYWIGKDEAQFGLEVSGTLTEDLVGRHAAKVRQLCENPHRADGYVAVAGFSTREAILSFHRAEEVSS